MAVDGSWKIRVKVPMGTQTGTLDLRTEGSTLAGSVTLRDDSLDILNGTIEGDVLTWDIKVKRPLPMTGHFTATIDGDSMAGRAKLGPMGEAPFEATRIAGD